HLSLHLLIPLPKNYMINPPTTKTFILLIYNPKPSSSLLLILHNASNTPTLYAINFKNYTTC
ncbi:hypothetical protein, partial [Priestia megaterium]|uniref:hypothetical protein n=1 Tax=Priestia megaterium TaxID=1404 RepID=UPI001C9A1A94